MCVLWSPDLSSSVTGSWGLRIGLPKWFPGFFFFFFFEMQSHQCTVQCITGIYRICHWAVLSWRSEWAEPSGMQWAKRVPYCSRNKGSQVGTLQQKYAPPVSEARSLKRGPQSLLKLQRGPFPPFPALGIIWFLATSPQSVFYLDSCGHHPLCVSVSYAHWTRTSLLLYDLILTGVHLFPSKAYLQAHRLD